MATIMYLPDDVIEIILGYNDISIDDIISFRFVWKEFHSIKYVEPWERIFCQRWPSAKKFHDKQYEKNKKKDSKENEQNDEKNSDFIDTGINCARELRDYVSQIIHKHYYDNESIDNLILFEDVFHLDQYQHLRDNIDQIINKPENFIKYCFFIDGIENLLTQSPQKTGCDLTKRYCHLKLLSYMKQHSMRKNKLNSFSYPDDLLERMATIIAQAIKPKKDVFYSHIKASLDNIALEILNCLKEKHPDHSIFSTSAQIFSYWKNNNINENHWNEVEGTQIIDTLEEYIFGKLNFRPCRLQDTNVEYMCIDNVLKNKCGQEIILLIIYHSVARRLGLRCDLIVHITRRGLFINIFWKPKHATKGSENIRCLSIISKKSPDYLVNQRQLLRQLYSESKELLEIRAAELWYVIKSLYIVPKLPDAPLQIIPNNSRNTSTFYVRSTKQFNTRPEDVKFAVGMIIRCQLTNCIGVIVGWHRNVDRHIWSIDRFWRHNINTQMYFRHWNFYTSRQQTHYIIFTEGNEMCYVGEDRITLTTPKWIDNSEIGRYFCKFEGTHYVPNQMLARHYPHDAALSAETKTTISESLADPDVDNGGGFLQNYLI